MKQYMFEQRAIVALELLKANPVTAIVGDSVSLTAGEAVSLAMETADTFLSECEKRGWVKELEAPMVQSLGRREFQ